MKNGTSNTSVVFLHALMV